MALRGAAWGLLLSGAGAWLQDLIAEGWHHSPQMRPSAREMVARLTDMQGDIEALEAACPRKVIAESAGTNAAGDGGCCVIS